VSKNSSKKKTTDTHPPIKRKTLNRRSFVRQMGVRGRKKGFFRGQKESLYYCYPRRNRRGERVKREVEGKSKVPEQNTLEGVEKWHFLGGKKEKKRAVFYRAVPGGRRAGYTRGPIDLERGRVPFWGGQSPWEGGGQAGIQPRNKGWRERGCGNVKK